MVKVTKSNTKGKNFRGQKIDRTTTKKSYSKRDIEMAKIRAEMGTDPITQRERMRQSGKTKRAAAYSTAVAASSKSIADSSQQAYYDMANGGLGYEATSNKSEDSGGDSQGKMPHEVVVGR